MVDPRTTAPGTIEGRNTKNGSSGGYSNAPYYNFKNMEKKLQDMLDKIDAIPDEELVAAWKQIRAERGDDWREGDISVSDFLKQQKKAHKYHTSLLGRVRRIVYKILN